MYKYTVIVPHKNIPKLLERCVISIPFREDIQIIVVDDNSTLENRTIAKKVCDKNPQITYVQDESGKGAGKARNIGLNMAQGQWVIFSDSDDFFEPFFWSEIDNVVIENEAADIIYFKTRAVDSETLENVEDRNKNNCYIKNFFNKKKYAEDELRFFYIVPWGKIFRHDFLRTNLILFDEVKAGNDVMFSTLSGSKANIIAASNIVMYVVTRREGSLVTQKDKEILRCRFEVGLRQNGYVTSIGKGRYSDNMIMFIWNYSVKQGFTDFFWYLKTLLKSPINPFIAFRRYIGL